ncbi:hypothetical protein CAC42_1806 [Sphaceloma murrayae]|uniref:DNA recombination and repair protein Rad51-like C-terminal domain-containing protein n=1 Tax=Sphaceloma murrayae TaxID=2082308 RepID=A0A2K1QVU1_9PEZI|nr:hypothetical protein CAC42_1806 [Sphaceloma murrayae]
MSVVDVGRKLLGEIEEGALAEVFCLAREELLPCKKYYIGVEPIDDLLDLFTTPVTVHGSSSPGRGHQENAHPKPRAQGPPCIEIASATPDNGKTQLLYFIIARALLPPTYAGVPLQGQHAAVLYFDTCPNFSVNRLVTIMTTHITHLIPSIAPPDLETLLVTSLTHLHIFTPPSLPSLLLTLSSLSDYLRAPHPSHHRALHSLVLSSATAYHWADRHDTEMANIPSTTEHVSRKRVLSGYPALRAALSKASKDLHCPVIYTATDPRPKYGPPSRSLKAVVPRSWETFPDVRVLVQRRMVRSFPIGTCAEEAGKDAGQRGQAVHGAGFDIGANEHGIGEWSAEVREEVRRGKGRARMRVDGQGVWVDR